MSNFETYSALKEELVSDPDFFSDLRYKATVQTIEGVIVTPSSCQIKTVTCFFDANPWFIPNLFPQVRLSIKPMI